MAAKKNKIKESCSIESSRPRYGLLLGAIGWLPQDAAALEVYCTVLEKYQKSLERNAVGGIRQWVLCSSLLDCWRDGKMPQEGCYEQEYSDFLLSVFRQALRTDLLDDAQRTVIGRVVKAGSPSGICSERLRAIDRVFTDGRRLDGRHIRELERNGFRVSVGGCNLHLNYGGQRFICPCTPSENRSGKNTASIIKRGINIEACYMARI